MAVAPGDDICLLSHVTATTLHYIWKGSLRLYDFEKKHEAGLGLVPSFVARLLLGLEVGRSAATTRRQAGGGGGAHAIPGAFVLTCWQHLTIAASQESSQNFDNTNVPSYLECVLRYM